MLQLTFDIRSTIGGCSLLSSSTISADESAMVVVSSSDIDGATLGDCGPNDSNSLVNELSSMGTTWVSIISASG